MYCKQKVQQQFEQYYGHPPQKICHAPGRVNLIGDHTDYNDGFVLPTAINLGTDIAASIRDDRKVRVLALDCDSEAVIFDLDSILFDTEKMWVNYIAGTLQALMIEFPDIKGADLVVAGDVPQGAGLSSSASLEIAVLKTFAQLNELPLDGVKAALMGQSAENNFVGCNCGIMDQLISSMGKTGHAMLLDCRSLTFQDSPIPKGLEVVIINSNVKRGLVDSEYNTRRTQCEKVASIFNKPALRDVSLQELDSKTPQLGELQYQRARHVITENIRTEQALVAMRNNDITKLSQLMRDSHQSLKDDFAVSTKELDGLVSIVDSVIKDKGGVRMTGGGFGGCVVALVPKEKVDDVFAQVNLQYPIKFGLTADIYICSPSAGAFRE